MRPRTLTVAGAAEELATVESAGPHHFPVSPRREEITPEHLGLGTILQKCAEMREASSVTQIKVNALC